MALPPEERHSLWAYDLLRPAPRRVRIRRILGPVPTPGTPGTTGLFLSSKDAWAALVVTSHWLGKRTPWPLPPFKRSIDASAWRRGPFGVAVEGLAHESPRRAAIETSAAPGDHAGRILLHKTSLCAACGECLPSCPAGCLALVNGSNRSTTTTPSPLVTTGADSGGLMLKIDETSCLSCMACVETCPRGALAPALASAAQVMAPDGTRPAGLLRTASPELAPPKIRQRQPDWQRCTVRPRPVYSLGLAIATMQENSAALLKDGRLVGAVEEERLSRVKHHGFRIPGRPNRTICNDMSVLIEEAFAWRSVNWLLKREGITLDDVAVIGVNGIPGRFRRSYSLEDAARPPRTLVSGRFVFVPHHQAHAASAYYFGGGADAHILTVDGRGDRETAAFFKGRDGRLERIFDVLSLDDSSIGGVYETVSRILGFGSHGQGSKMALAVMGDPRFDLSSALSIETHSRHRIHENQANKTFGHLSRGRFDPLTEDHKALAASVQLALEEAIIRLIDEGRGGEVIQNLGLAGGVALNCQMNSRIQQHFQPQSMFVQPAAHDGGTAIGAALVAHLELTSEPPFQPLVHACWGPEPEDTEIQAALDAFGLPARRAPDIAVEVGERIAAGQVVAWCQSGLEIGPRALGARSLLAHPGRQDFHPRLNVAKGREAWRPFAPSILAGHEADWFDNPNGNGFMLFVAGVRKDRREAVSAIVHHDGTTRPQSVHADAQPLYHRAISEFHRRTGIPLVLNTSFNTADEPIATSPQDALNSFLQVGADCLAIGEWLVERPGANASVQGTGWRRPAQETPPPRGPVLAASDQQRFGRLLLRLGSRCNSACIHCTIRDIAHLPERDTEAAINALREGRAHGCNEVVFLRGEPLIRKDILRLITEARVLGYNHVQIQTNGRVLAYPGLARLLARKGVSFFEVSIYGSEPDIHDKIAQAPGAFDQTVAGIRSLKAENLPFLINIPVLAANSQHLESTVRLLADIGASRVQFALSRPVWLGDQERLDVAPTVRISRVASHLRTALRTARSLGLEARTEGVVLCHLDPDLWDAAESPGPLNQQLVAELDGLRPASTIRAESRPKPVECGQCTVAWRCPGPWAGSTRLFGSQELLPLT